MEHFLFVAFVISWGFLANAIISQPRRKLIYLNKNTAKLTIASFKQLRR